MAGPTQNSTKPLQVDFTYTNSFVDILEKFGLSVIVTTYQAGLVMSLSAKDRKPLIDYASFPKPMGMTAKRDKVWAGLGHEIWEFVNFKEAAKQIEPKGTYAAAYIPLNIHNSGDIDIHEMEYCNGELYFINTKFSCLCKYDPNHSFKPIWKPPFISDLLPVDKCHLNGLAIKENRPKYVTALGRSDEPLGWRKNKQNGGILMDIENNDILIEGLSMPHSPRWYRGKIWYQESGKGTLSYFDPITKEKVDVVQIPGFTRGLTFAGDLAFVGVSKVRESATFGALPITKLEKRVAGVWIVHTTAKKILGYFAFERGVDEIFAVNLVPYRRIKFFNVHDPFVKSQYLIAPEDVESIKMPDEPVEVAATYYEKGRDLINEKKFEEAIEAFKKTLDIHRDYIPAALELAKIYLQLGNKKDAKYYAEYVIENDASIAEAYEIMSKIYRNKNSELSKQYLEKAHSLKQN